MKHAIINLYNRDIDKLISEINLFPSDASLWLLKGTVTNSAGTLGLHLVGNLNHFIGAVLGKTGYIRERELEFSTRNVSKSDLIALINDTKNIVNTTLNNLIESELLSEYPLESPSQSNKGSVTTDFMLMHLLAHLNYHLGQINYHRRLLQE